jgi:circadian clock protein KaiB
VTTEDEVTLGQFEDRLLELARADYVLTLFVTGASERSVRAISNVRAICDKHLHGRYHLEVVDVYRDVALMTSYNVLAAPTLIKEFPLPKRRLVGDLSDTDRVLDALDIQDPITAKGSS